MVHLNRAVIPGLTALVIALVSARISWTILQDEHRDLAAAAHQQMMRVWTDLRTGVDAAVQVLDDVAQLNEPRRPDLDTAVTLQGCVFLNKHPEIEEIARIDADGHVACVVHARGSGPLASRLSRESPATLAALVGAVRTQTTHVTGPVHLAGDGLGFMLVRHTPGGALVAVVRYSTLFQEALDPDLLRDCAIQLRDGARIALTRGDLRRSAWTFEYSYPLQDRTWSLRVSTTAGALPLSDSSLPAIVLGGGSLLALLVGSLLWMMRAAQRRAALMQDLNGDLASQIHERRRLESELARRMSDLEKSNAELEQFAYVASHDLQEPLRMVASYTQLLAERYRGQLDERAHTFIGFAVDGALRMQTLIHDLLDYARASKAKQELTSVDLNGVVREALVDLEATLRSTGAAVTFDKLPRVMGHRGRLAQLFTNLISNACKFHRPDTAPHVHIAIHPDDGAWIVSVRDNGIGIAVKHQERIFQIFERLHPRSRYPGTGIGLALCHRIVDLHGGRIWVESEEGRGATFHFSLPLPLPGGADVLDA